jgi:hypothetical protein
MKFKIDITRLFTIFLFVATIIFVACKKETSATNSVDEKNFSEIASNSNIEASQYFDDVYNNVMGVNSQVAFGQTGVFDRINTVDSSANPSFIVTSTRLNAPALFPVEIDIDFGKGCTGKDGVVRKGKIITVYSARLTHAGSSAQTSFDNFYIDDTKIEGAELIKNISNSQQMIFKAVVTDGKLTKQNSNYSIFNSNNTITQVDEYSTPGYAKDDVLSITGESNGSLKNDSIFLKWNTKTVTPLMKKFTCRWIVKGKVSIMEGNTDAGIIDFGNGDCDNKVNLELNTSTVEISLH